MSLMPSGQTLAHSADGRGNGFAHEGGMELCCGTARSGSNVATPRAVEGTPPLCSRLTVPPDSRAEAPDPSSSDTAVLGDRAFQVGSRGGPHPV